MPKLYVLLTSTGTLLNKAIKKFTNEPYNHSSIAFDKELLDVYSFGRKYTNNPLIGTFVKEDIRSGLYVKQSETVYSLYSLEVSDEQFKRARDVVDEFERRKTKLRYNFIGLFGVTMKIPIERRDAYFCSQFVAKVFEMAGISLFGKAAGLVTPYDFAKSRKLRFEYRGKLRNYHSSKLKKEIVQEVVTEDEILSEAMINTENLDKLDEQFQHIIEIENGVRKGNSNKHFAIIDQVLHKKFNIESKTSIIRGSNSHFGACVYPSYEEINKISIEVLDSNGENPTFNEITDVKIFFDERLVKGFYGGMTSRELTAILLHEIGHKIFVNETRSSLIKMVVHMRLAGIFGLIASSARLGAARSDLQALRIMLEMVFFSLFTGNVISKMTNDRVEKMADSFATRCGYGPELASGLSKLFAHIKGKGTKINDEPSKINLIKWMFVTLSHFSVRKNNIVKVLEHELHNANTPYEKDMIERQISELKTVLGKV